MLCASPANALSSRAKHERSQLCIFSSLSPPPIQQCVFPYFQLWQLRQWLCAFMRAQLYCCRITASRHEPALRRDPCPRYLSRPSVSSAPSFPPHPVAAGTMAVLAVGLQRHDSCTSIPPVPCNPNPLHPPPRPNSPAYGLAQLEPAGRRHHSSEHAISNGRRDLSFAYC